MVSPGTLLLFLKGALIGFSIAAPVGPIGIICIRKTLARGMRYGFVSGLGAASADGCYGIVAAAGITSISSLLIQNALYLRIIGGTFLLYLGIKTIISPPGNFNTSGSPLSATALAMAFTSVFFLTLTNPMTIISFSAIFAGLGLGSHPDSISGAAAIVGGVFSGSASWWFFLSLCFGLLKMKLTESILKWINIFSGAIIGSFGVFSLVSTLF